MNTRVLLTLILALNIVVPLHAGDSATNSTTRPPAEGSPGSAPAPGPEIKPIGGGKVELEPKNAPPVTREDAPGNQPKPKP